MKTIAKHLIPNAGALILAGLLLLVQAVSARQELAPAQFQAPSQTQISYQGRLADASGTPIDGQVTLQFALYATDVDPNPVWGPETHPNVPVSDGLFSVILGAQSGGIPQTILGTDLWLGIIVEGETLNPRERLNAVPYAMQATEALAVPDGTIKSNDLDLDHVTVCLSGHAQVSLPGGYQRLEVPGLGLTFSLDRASLVLVWIDGLAKFEDGASAGQADIALHVDGEEQTSSFHWTDDNLWFNVKGQRVLNLESGTHTMTVFANSLRPGTMTIHGVGGFRTCVNYMVLGEQ